MKKILEKDIQREICDWLHSQGYFFWRNNTIPVFGMSGSGFKRFRALPKYTPRGLPDILIVHKGFFIGFEVKIPSEKGGTPQTKEAQTLMKQKIMLAGGYYFVVHSLPEAQGKLLAFQ